VGTLAYDTKFTAYFDDRVLAHLQVVIGAKLRRGESFHFSWTMGENVPGRTTLWLHPTVPLVYTFSDNSEPRLNRLWIEALMASANSAAGLHIVDEPIPAIK